jgi:hypothetical protein
MKDELPTERQNQRTNEHDMHALIAINMNTAMRV